MSLILRILSVLIALPFINATNIPNNSVCLIQNRLFSESGFLYPEYDQYNHDSSRRRIYAEKFNPISGSPPLCLPSNDHCKWKFEEHARDDQENRYKIKSMHYDEYLYSAADDLQRDENRRNSFTWIGTSCNDPECYWFVEQVPDTNFYTLKNERYRDHLYASSTDLNSDNKRRSVFGWRWYGDAGVNTDKASHWTLMC